MFSLAQIVEITGSDRRAVQFWADNGALIAKAGTSRAGRGTHRRFARDEVVIACVLNAVFANSRATISVLLKLADSFRAALKYDALRKLVNSAIAEQKLLFMVYRRDGEIDLLGGLSTAELKRLLDSLGGWTDPLVLRPAGSDRAHSFFAVINLTPWLNDAPPE